MSSAFTTLEQPTKGCRWTSSATSFSAPLRSEASNLFDYGSPTSWGHSSRSPSPPPRARGPSPRGVGFAGRGLREVFSEGFGFDGLVIEGLSRIFESDLLAFPDPTTFQTLPWRGDVDPT